MLSGMRRRWPRIMPCGLPCPPMARTPLMHRLQRIARDIARREAEGEAPARREFLRRASALAAASVLPSWSPVVAGAEAARVVIVGAGLAGLTAAYTLGKSGIRATLVEGSPRIGGRCWSDRETFADGQVAERG